MGVSLALEKLDELMEEGGDGPILTLGPIIHNPQVLEYYAGLGVGCIASPQEAPPGARVVIRAHGVPRQVQAELAARGLLVVDATCPKVKKAQLLIAHAGARGRALLLYGEAEHPEVRGLVSYAPPDAVVFDDPGDLPRLLAEHPRAFLAAQTTQDRASFEAMRDRIAAADADVPVLETICDATRVRQEEAIRIARKVEIMVVVGGLESGNTRRLFKVVAAQGTPCVHVETSAQLRPGDFRGRSRTGLTAGASTPLTIIDAVHERLLSF